LQERATPFPEPVALETLFFATRFELDHSPVAVQFVQPAWVACIRNWLGRWRRFVVRPSRANLGSSHSDRDEASHNKNRKHRDACHLEPG
jgi:hypothetical protein